MSEDLGRLIRCRMRELELDPATFVFNRFGGENITRTYDYLKGFDEDPTMHPIPEPTCRALAEALEVPYEQVRAASSESYRRLTAGWGVGLVPHANIVLHPDDTLPWTTNGFINILKQVKTRIDFVPDSHPDTFIDQAVRGLRGRNLKHRRFHSLVINYAWGKAVRVDAAGREIERLGDEDAD